MNTKKAKIRYFRNENGFPIGCLAFQIDHSNRVMTFGISVWNARDAWNRRVALEVAEGRCVRSKTPQRFWFNTTSPKTADILREFMEVIAVDEINFAGKSFDRIRQTIPTMIKRLNSEAANGE